MLDLLWPHNAEHADKLTWKCYIRHIDTRLGTHFTNNISIKLKIRWKFHFALILIPKMWSLQIFAYDMTALLSCHVQNFVVIWYQKFELQQNEFSFKIWIVS